MKERLHQLEDTGCHQHTITHTVEPVYYGHLGTDKECPDYQGVLIFQVSLPDKVPFGTITVWIMQVSLFSSVLINTL